MQRGGGLRARDGDAGSLGQPRCDFRASECDREEHSHEHPGPYKESRILHRNSVHIDQETGEPEQGNGAVAAGGGAPARAEAAPVELLRDLQEA